MIRKQCGMRYVLYLINIDDKDRIYVWITCQIYQESLFVMFSQMIKYKSDCDSYLVMIDVWDLNIFADLNFR